MKKNLGALILILVCIFMLLTYKMYNYYAPPQQQEPFLLNTHNDDDTLQIAYIGDSWAYNHQEHNCHIEQILEDSIHQPVRVLSYGICGSTSKEIYESMFRDNDLSRFLQKHNFSYCIISAGINDTYKKMSTSYYKKSMDGIIQLLLANHIHPVIMEIPDYHIEKAYERQTDSKKILRKISMIVNKTPLDCKQLFRKALDDFIQEKKYSDKVNIIRYQSWNNNYLNDLNTLYLKDGMHLNEKGYAKLDSVIANEIMTLFDTTRHNQ